MDQGPQHKTKYPKTANEKVGNTLPVKTQVRTF